MVRLDLAQTKRKPTLSDVAERVGVSTATVSYVLRGIGAVSDQTRRRVLDAAREVGYPLPSRPPAITIGVLYPPGYSDDKTVQEHEIYGRFVEGIQQAVSRLDRCTVSYIPNHPTSFVLQHFQTHGLDGMIFFGVDATHRAVQTARENGIPCVLLNHRGTNGVSSIQAANYDATVALAEHLINDHGYRRLVFLQSDPAASFTVERYDGARAAVERALAQGATLKLLRYHREIEPVARAIADLGTSVDAVIVDRVVIAGRLVEALKAIGVRVPEDVAVVGFDDLQMAADAKPSLTTVRFDAVEMGRRAARALASLVAKEVTEIHVKLPCEVVRRSSCGCPPPKGRRRSQKSRT